jgi:ribosomal protein S18 acetylase RimI-like enzyme
MSESSITIRRAAPTDLPALLNLLNLYYEEWDIWQRDPEPKVLNDLNHPTLGFFLAEIESGVSTQPAACVLLRDLPKVPHAAECKRLFVSPEYRGHSLADALMQHVEDHARDLGLHWIYLDTKDEFTAAIALYRRRGYEDTARYNDNLQATIFLRKAL